MRSLAQYGLICVLFMVLMGCGKSDQDVAKLKKEMEDLKASTQQMAAERDKLKKQMAEEKKTDAEKPPQAEPTKTERPAVEPAKKKQAEPETRPQSEQTQPQAEEAQRPEKIASESSPSNKKTDEKVPDTSGAKSQMCDAIDAFLKTVDSAQEIDDQAKRKSKMDEALNEVLEARAKLLASKNLSEISAKVYVAAYGVKLNAETIAKFRKESDRGTEKFAKAMEQYRKELKSLCSGW